MPMSLVRRSTFPLPAPNSLWVIKINLDRPGRFVSGLDWPDNFPIDVVANVGSPFQGDHVHKAGTRGNLDRREPHTGILVADILDKQHQQHMIFVLAGIRAATQFVVACPQRGIQFRFLTAVTSYYVLIDRPLRSGLSPLFAVQKSEISWRNSLWMRKNGSKIGSYSSRTTF